MYKKAIARLTKFSIRPVQFYEEVSKHISSEVLLEMEETNLMAFALLYDRVVEEVPDKEVRIKLMPKMLRVAILTHGVKLPEAEKPETNVFYADFKKVKND